MKSCLVVVSHYNAWPVDHLVALLDQMQEIPPGRPFLCRVVVNKAEDKPLELPERHAGVEVCYRENSGYNIGAWDLGWRQDPPADFYLFLQEECRILRPGWLEVFVRMASRPEVGLVGESLVWPGYDWDRIEYHHGKWDYPGDTIDGSKLNLPAGVRQFLEARGIPAGRTGEHLQALIVCARRDVLEAIGGFLIGATKGEAISCEVAMSRAAALKGFKLRQVGLRPFRYILHPQWQYLDAGFYGVLRGWVDRYAPIALADRMRKSVHGLKKALTGRAADA